MPFYYLPIYHKLAKVFTEKYEFVFHWFINEINLQKWMQGTADHDSTKKKTPSDQVYTWGYFGNCLVIKVP